MIPDEKINSALENFIKNNRGMLYHGKDKGVGIDVKIPKENRISLLSKVKDLFSRKKENVLIELDIDSGIYLEIDASRVKKVADIKKTGVKLSKIDKVVSIEDKDKKKSNSGIKFFKKNK